MSERQYRELVENINDVLYVCDTSGVITYISPAIESISEFSSQEATGQHYSRFIHEDDRELAAAQFKETLAGQAVVAEYRACRKSGGLFWMRNSSRPLMLGGSVAGVRGSILDITAPKLAEHELAMASDLSAAMAEVSRSLLLPHTIDEVADLVLGCAKKLTGSPVGYVGYIDEPTGHLIAPTLTREIWHACKVPDKGIVFEEFTGLWGWVLNHREPLMANCAREDPRWGGGPPQGHVPIERFLSAPALAEGALLGQVSVANSLNEYTPRDLGIVQRLADLFALAVRHQRAVEAVQRGRDRMEEKVRQRTVQLSQANEALSKEVAVRKTAEERALRSATYARSLARVAIRIGAHLGLPGIMNAVCEEAVRALGMQRCSLFLYEAEHHLLARAHTAGRCLEFAARESFPLSLFEQFCRTDNDVVVIPDVGMIPDVPYAELLRRDDVRTVAAAAMRHRQELVGVLIVLAIGAARWLSREESEFLRALAEQTAAAISHARLYDEQQAAKARLQALNRRLAEVQEQERHRMARDLHDELGQGLTQLRLMVETAAGAANTDPPQELRDAKQLVRQLIARTREMTLELRPRSLDDLGLLPAICALTDHLGQRTDVMVEVKANLGDGRFRPEVETAAFRIVQEALANVARHAGVKTASVRLWSDVETLRVQVEDSGKGFDLRTALLDAQTSGLIGMRERAESAGGQLTIESNPGLGTCITADIPLRF